MNILLINNLYIYIGVMVSEIPRVSVFGYCPVFGYFPLMFMYG